MDTHRPDEVVLEAPDEEVVGRADGTVKHFGRHLYFWPVGFPDFEILSLDELEKGSIQLFSFCNHNWETD